MLKPFQPLLLAAAALSSIASYSNTDITVFDASITPIIPTASYKGIRVLVNGTPTKEISDLSKIFKRDMLVPDALQVDQHLRTTLDYYRNKFGRLSFDNQNKPIIALVNANRYMPLDLFKLHSNAAWVSQSLFFLFGHGDQVFLPFTGGLDVIAHEFTHAVVSYTSNLEYNGQSGALNESMADVFSALVSMEVGQYEATAFLVGESILTDFAKTKYKTEALRSMFDPHLGLRWQPAKVSEMPAEFNSNCSPNRDNDNCGVHTLSGIPNKVAQLIISQIGEAKAGDLYYKVMTEKLEPKSQFIDLRKTMIGACFELGYSSDICQIVTNAFNQVEIFE